MKLADPNRDYRVLVRDSYDQIAGAFNAARSTEPAAELAPLLAVLPERARILDLGCGTGVPVAKTLAARHDVIGVDLSGRQLALARQQVPGAQFVRADMSRVSFGSASFDAVVSFYAIFHLPLEEHAALIGHIGGWLKPGRYFLTTLSPMHEEAYTEDFFGAEMYWSNLGLDEYRDILAASDFAIVSEGVTGHGYSDEDAKPERHPLILARLKE